MLIRHLRKNLKKNQRRRRILMLIRISLKMPVLLTLMRRRDITSKMVMQPKDLQ
jgi:hypothetical protein